MYITGVGRTRFGKLQESLSELSRIATEHALEDASMGIHDIDAVYVSNFCAGPMQHQLHLNALMADALKIWGIPIVRVETACASGGAALHQGTLVSQTYRNILVIGVERLTDNPKMAIEGLSMAADRASDQLNGLIFPAAYALIASQYMKRYGVTLRDLAYVSYKNHSHANMNEYAQFYSKRLTMRDIMNSPVVCSPLRLYDCSPISDGACAIIITNKKRNNRDVRIAASALSTGSLTITNLQDLTSFPAAVLSAKKAYTQAGLRPKDIDIASVHDCFTVAEMIAMEDVGLCVRGDAKSLIRKKKTWYTGAMPVNTDGGLKANGHPIGASGLAQIFELVTQLRGEAGERQVKNARLALAHNIGGVGGTAVIHILESGQKYI